MNLFGIYWGTVIVALPLFIRFTHHALDRTVKDGFFVAAAFVSLFLFGLTRKPEKWQLPVVFGLTGLFVLSFFNQYTPFSAQVWLQWICMGAWISVLFQMIFTSEKSDWAPIFTGIRISGTVQSGWIVLNSFGLDPLLLTGPSVFPEAIRLHGSLGNIHYSGALVAASLPFMVNRRWLPGLLLGLWATGLAWNRISVLLAASAGLVTLAIMTFRDREDWKLDFGLTAFIPLSLGWAWSESTWLSDGGRFSVWKNALSWRTEWHQVFFGNGLGFFSDQYRRNFSDHPFTMFHNEFLEAYFAFGVAGLLLLLCSLNSFRFARPTPVLSAGIAAILANSLTFSPFHISSVSLIGAVCFGLLLSQKEEENGSFSF